MKKIIKNKKAVAISSAFYALISISIVIIAIGVWTNEWNQDYSSGLTYDLGEDYNKLDRISSEAGGQKGNLTIRSSIQEDNFEGTSIKGVFGILNNIYAPFRIVFGDGGMIDSLTDRFGLPDYIRQGFITIIIMAFTYALIKIFFRLPDRRI